MNDSSWALEEQYFNSTLSVADKGEDRTADSLLTSLAAVDLHSYLCTLLRNIIHLMCATENGNQWLPGSQTLKVNWCLLNTCVALAQHNTFKRTWLYIPCWHPIYEQTVLSISSESTEMSEPTHPCQNITMRQHWSLLPFTSLGLWEICCNRPNLTAAAAGFFGPVERRYSLNQSE